jgi:hypothetical protein
VRFVLARSQPAQDQPADLQAWVLAQEPQNRPAAADLDVVRMRPDHQQPTEWLYRAEPKHSLTPTSIARSTASQRVLNGNGLPARENAVKFSWAASARRTREIADQNERRAIASV